MRALFIIALFLCLCFSRAHGQSFYPGAGVSTSATANIIPPHTTQIFLNNNTSDSGFDDLSKTPLIGITQGVSPGCCISAGYPYMTLVDGMTNAQGFKDLRLGLKQALTPVNKDLRLTAVLGVKPQTTSNLQLSGNSSTDYSSLLAFTYDFPHWSITANYGWDWWGQSGSIPAGVTPFSSLLVSYLPSPRYTLSSEVYTSTTQSNNGYSSPCGFNLLAGWKISRQWEAGVGMSFGLNSQSTLRQYMLSVSYTRD